MTRWTYTYSLQDVWIVQTTTGSGQTRGYGVTTDGQLCNVDFRQQIKKPEKGVQMKSFHSKKGRADKFVISIRFDASEREIRAMSRAGMTTVGVIEDTRSLSWVFENLPQYAASLVSGNGPVRDLVY